MSKDTYEKFTSHLGNSFIAPSMFEMYDKGDTFAVNSPDGQASICAIMYTAEGSGSFIEFCGTMAPALLPDEVIKTDWTTIELGGNTVALKCALTPASELDSKWWFYGVDGGRFYHAISLRVSNLALQLNGDFYENIVRTFSGVSE